MTGTPAPSDRLTSFFDQLAIHHELVGDNMWLCRSESLGLTHIVVYAQDELVTIRVKIAKIPVNDRCRFFEDLLRLNIEMLHGAYSLEEDAVIWVDTLALATLDFEELRASLEAASISVAEHYPRLAHYLQGDGDGDV